MKAFSYSVVLLLLLLPFFTNATVTDTARLRLTVSNENKNPITLQAGDWQYRVEPGKTVSIDERLNEVSVPYTVTVNIIGMTVQSHTLTTELRILDGTYTGRKLQVSKNGVFRFESIHAEMDWYQFTSKNNPF